MKVIKAFLIMVLVIVLAGGVVFGLAVWGETLPTLASADTSSMETKFKDALMGDGVMELTPDEINSAAALALGDEELGGLKGVYIDLVDDKMEASTVVNKFGIDFFVRVTAVPHMSDKESIIMTVDSVHVGKLPIPKGIAMTLMRGMLPSGIKVVGADSFDIGNKILMFRIKDMSVSGNMLRVELLNTMPSLTVDDKGKVSVKDNSTKPKEDSKGAGTDTNTPAQDNTPAKEDNSELQSAQHDDQGTAPAQDGGASVGGDTQADDQTQGIDDTQAAAQEQAKAEEETWKKVTALMITNEQMYNVLSAVKNQDGKSWVSRVISVNSKMIDDPNGDFSGEISSAKAAYTRLPADVRSQIKSAALKKMDTSSVMFLVSAYGI